MSISNLESSLLKKEGVRHGFSTRMGGVSTELYSTLNFGGNVGDKAEFIEENHQRFARSLDVQRQDLYTVHQVHGSEIVMVENRSQRKEIASFKADALISVRKGIGVGIRTADCAPILFFARDHGAVAAVHAGWRGTVSDIVGTTVSALQTQYQIMAKQLVVAIGPCIGPCCFEVGPEVLQAFSHAFTFDGWRGKSLPNNKGTVDLYRANEFALRRSGVTVFESLRFCTMCEKEKFFSYRRDGQFSGRHLSVIVSEGMS